MSLNDNKVKNDMLDQQIRACLQEQIKNVNADSHLKDNIMSSILVVPEEDIRDKHLHSVLQRFIHNNKEHHVRERRKYKLRKSIRYVCAAAIVVLILATGITAYAINKYTKCSYEGKMESVDNIETAERLAGFKIKYPKTFSNGFQVHEFISGDDNISYLDDKQQKINGENEKEISISYTKTGSTGMIFFSVSELTPTQLADFENDEDDDSELHQMNGIDYYSYKSEDGESQVMWIKDSKLYSLDGINNTGVSEAQMLDMAVEINQL